MILFCKPKSNRFLQIKNELFLNLSDKSSRTVVSHGNRVNVVRIDSSGEFLVTGDMDGIVRVGPISGDEPHLLFKHESMVRALAIDPNGHWIVSGEWNQPIVRIWPMPKGQPLQMLNHEELLARLRALTNIRVVADPATSTGYRIKFDAFRGWVKAPIW